MTRNTSTLTGATRVRADTTAAGRNVLVFQVETRYLDGPHSTYDEAEWVYLWRDAVVEDVTEHQPPLGVGDGGRRK